MPKKEEIIASIQQTAEGLDATLYFLPETQRPGSLGTRADLLESYAEELLSAAQDLRNLATAQQELQTAVQSIKSGRS
jgi:hypothetical protein